MAESREFLIRVGIRRNYGEHEVYFEMSEQVECLSGEERREAFYNLLGQVDDQIKLYENFSLPAVKLPPRALAGSQNSNGAMVSFKVQSISVEFKDGKRYVSAKGGEYQKFGVPIYPECDTQWPVETADFGVHDVKSLNLTAQVEIEGGKPKRVRVMA